jgi:hypothetical protein
MMRVRNKTAWQVDAATPPELLGDDFMVIPEGMQAGDTHAFTRLPPSQDPAHGHQPLDGLRNLTLLVAADSATSAPMVQQAMQAGARARGAALTAEVHQMGEAVRAVASGAAAAAAGGGGGGGAGGLDLLYLGLGPSSSKGTLETDAHEWERLFLSACKAPYCTARHHTARRPPRTVHRPPHHTTPRTVHRPPHHTTPHHTTPHHTTPHHTTPHHTIPHRPPHNRRRTRAKSARRRIL